jgi:hypothetical protein
MNTWWRAYNNSIHHPKLIKLSDEMHRAWYTLNCIASDNGGTLPAADDIAVMLRVKPTKVAEWITKLVTAKLMDNQDGVFVPHNWETRQFKSDTSTGRVRAHREKTRNVSKKLDGNVSFNDVNETDETPPEQSRAETEQIQSRADARAPDDLDLKKRATALGIAVGALFSVRNMTVPDTKRCMVWLSQGYAQGTILSAVEAVLKRGRPIATLDYFDGAIADMHAKGDPAPELQVVAPTKNVFVVAGTPEWNAHQDERSRRGMPPSPIIDEKDTQRRPTGRVGFWFSKLVPDGYDQATCERLPPKSEGEAA